MTRVLECPRCFGQAAATMSRQKTQRVATTTADYVAEQGS